MTNPPDQTPATDDRRGELRQLLAQGADFAAALADIAQDDPRREADVIRQVRAWRRQLGTILDHFAATPAIADQASAISRQIRAEGKRPSPFEIAARLIEHTDPEDTSTQ